MMSRHFLLNSLAIASLIIFASNGAKSKQQFNIHIEKFDKCITTDALRGVFAAKNAKWLNFTRVQYVFLRTIYIDSSQNKSHAAPHGDKAAVAFSNDATTALVLFIDDDKACAGMQVGFDILNQAIELQ